MAESNPKTYLFESMPIPKAVPELSVPMVVTSLVMIITIWRILSSWVCSMTLFRMRR